MNCNCPEGYILEVVGEENICKKTTIITDVECPPGCSTIIDLEGNTVCSCLEVEEPTVLPIRTLVSVSDTSYFKEVSFTIAYKPTEGRWNSYHSITPDFYISHQQHFQQGNNYGVDAGKIWSHTLGNSSFQVFNGRLEPFIVEYVNVNQGANKILESVSLEVESRRWQNEYDYAVKKGVGFNKVVVYNSTNNSGVLNLFEQKNNNDVRNYPKTNTDNTQDILYSSLDGVHTFNYFYNRVIQQENNVPIWIWNESMSRKNINPRAVSFKGKRLLERIRGSYFFVRLTNDKESRYQISFNKAENKEIVG